MIGYVIRVDELEKMQSGEQIQSGKKEIGELLFVTPQETEQNYPIPSAFAAYTEYMDIKLGI